MPEESKEAGGFLGWLKNHPAVLVAIATGAGVSGDHVTELVSNDIPGWTLGAVVLLFAGVSWAKKIVGSVTELVGEFHQFRVDTESRLVKGDELIDKIVDNMDRIHNRLEALETSNSNNGASN